MRRAGVGFLACPGTLPNSPTRRSDAFEHDRQVDALRPALAAQRIELIEIDWAAPLEDFGGLSLVMLGTAWDYQDRKDEFLARLEALETRGVAACNPPDVVRWNATKTYLMGLAERGAATVPTLWLDDASHGDVVAAFDHFGTDRVVVKRQVGAGALGQHSFTCDHPPAGNWTLGHPAMIQPFLPAIAEEGEYSFVFIEGEFSHAILKRPAAGDYRIQSMFGGIDQAITPAPADLASARAVLASLPFSALLYARIDMIRLADGALAVMEAELIEPFLYPLEGPELGERLATALANLIT